MQQSDPIKALDSIPFWQAFLFWLKLGFISFGGPAGQIAVMHQELVEQKRWISEKRFLHALNYCILYIKSHLGPSQYHEFYQRNP